MLGLGLLLVPPVATLVLAALSVGLTRHDRANVPPPPPVYDVLFPLAVVATFVCVPLGVYNLYRAFKRDV